MLFRWGRLSVGSRQEDVTRNLVDGLGADLREQLAGVAVSEVGNIAREGSLILVKQPTLRGSAIHNLVAPNQLKLC